MTETKTKAEKAELKFQPVETEEPTMVGPGRLQALEDLFDGERIIQGPKGDSPGEVFDSATKWTADQAAAVDSDTPLGIPYVPPAGPGDPRLHAPRPGWTTAGYVERANRAAAQRGLA